MKFVAFDLETTGTQPREDMILEIGAVLFDGGNPVQGYGTLIDPCRAIPIEATAVNGITNEMVRGKPKINEVLDEFAAFCGDLPMVAHNAPFDFKFLLDAVQLHRSKAPKGVVLDTLPLARKVFPGLPNYKLWTLVRYFNFPSSAFHRAEEDSSYCGLLFAKIVETLQIRGESYTEEDLVDMIGKDAQYFPQFAKKPDQLTLF